MAVIGRCSILLLLLLSLLVVHSAVYQSELSQIMQTLWNVDVNRYSIDRDITLNLQGKASPYNDIDKASARLFASVPNFGKKSTYKKFMVLLDNYNPLVHVHDKSSVAEKKEQETFVNSILGTTVWQQARTFLTTQGYVSSRMQLTREVHRIWFTEYSRAKGNLGSSGFEHVFVGELDDNKMEISGFHNWITMYQLESSRTIDYQGYLEKDTSNNIYSIKLRQQNYTKFGNTMFIGTSPEFEMAVYTICFLTRQNQECQFTMNGNQVTIQTYTSYNNALATAYPKL